MDDFDAWVNNHPFVDLDVEVPEFALPYVKAADRSFPGLSLPEQDFISMAAMACHERRFTDAERHRERGGYAYKDLRRSK